MTSMTGILAKELRENAKWLLAIVLGLGLLLAVAAFGVRTALSMVSQEFQLATAFGFSATGLLVGLSQVLVDEKRGRSAFVTHRPFSLSNLFISKVLAGLVIYLVGAGIPLLAVTIAVSTPGHVAAPFEWHMILPALADLMGGILCYFAGALIAARPARWLGSRITPVAFAIVFLILAFGFSLSFLGDLAFILIGILIFAPAAWGAFVSRGNYERQPWIIRSLQTLCVGVGIGIAAALACSLVSSALHLLLYGSENDSGYVYPRYEYQTGGDVVLVTPDGSGERLTDLNGSPLTDSATREFNLERNHLDMAFLLTRGPLASHVSWSDRIRYDRFRDSSAYLLPLYGRTGNYQWYYVPDRRTIEAIDPLTGHLAGSFGPDGYLPPDATPRPFPSPLMVNLSHEWDSQLISSASAVDELNLREHQAKRIFSAAPGDPILSAGVFASQDANDAAGSRKLYIAVLTEASIHVFNDGRELFQLPAEKLPVVAAEVGRLRNGHFLIRYVQSGSAGLLIDTDPTGQITRRTTLPALKPIGSPPPGAWLGTVQLLPAPPLAVPLVLAFRDDIFFGRDMAALLLLGVASAAVCFKICHRFAFGKPAELTWSILGLLFGFPAVLTLLCMRNYPARVACPDCRKLRVVNRAACEHCRMPFARPPAEGIEIFEPAFS